ncbi:MAG: hypothetical protein UX85_C0007G0089 [Candidatus Beckwithbacteria bacterium GW2011_GWB1_47_15]|uniref:Uncharacterized protein n=1 Tax=Candidatus Beckwithbacteria bacterium GW2011_GWB1_47_15 TaxID=1618371 RepID=A0A0G1RUH7_9BACT|nr:MAG: hypothetical protein UX50_C0006G0084 [Candidatus Beckwithbacteria bacterium GW2011_GWA1_46_30]KKU60802.1 MAG: hypothetical protein UX85_C0007G0089 [Candidatus Beckwithbacteria bacterium GW2011_GWB1_47_15]KKU71607.1 MAG: hypothetical protein UX97_C0005G0090 [Candidatus Beckwithbacteria bacterium GW2011_GWA2_47_25]KKW03440.1 MAG: hypothetical protein UY37_C0005G0003 [Candidatus Beckwithbacteria bacterium GW2011_GWC2_49_11]
MVERLPVEQEVAGSTPVGHPSFFLKRFSNPLGRLEPVAQGMVELLYEDLFCWIDSWR